MRARELHGQSLTDWEILFCMRHHGVVIRLLDCTEVFAVALYLAVEGAGDGRTPWIRLLRRARSDYAEAGPLSLSLKAKARGL